MYRRRRRSRDIPFGLDCFLDVIANVVGIIIRLILVAWVGARSYDSISRLAQAERPAALEESAEPEHPLLAKLALARAELEQTTTRLHDLLPELQQYEAKSAQLRQQLADLTAQREQLAERRKLLTGSHEKEQVSLREIERALADLRQRRAQLDAELRGLEQALPAKRELRYRTPVSRPVHAEEMHFECKNGRVAFVDIGAFVDEIRSGLEEKSRLLRTNWQVRDVTRPVGAFRLVYTIERERDALTSLTSGGVPDAEANFRYGLSQWVVEPIAPQRGETLETALTPGSEFRRVIDGADPRHTVVTFWVYPDSFAAFRGLRDHLYEQSIEVAGRPLPDGIPIASSRHGTASRGQ
jgi:hypothetical protein